MGAVLALIGVAVRHSWISTQPLAAGDWAWRDGPRLSSYFPWPGIWDPSLGLGGANRFLAAFRFPVYAVAGLMSRLGASWTVIEKLLYFVPFAALLPVAGWLLAREIMGSTRWTLLTPLLLLGNTYFLIESNGEIPLTLSEAIGMVALLGFLRAMRRRSLGWALLTGLLVAAACAFDIRPAYLCVVLMAMYFVILALTTLDWRVLVRRAMLGVLVIAVFVGTQAFWLLPLLSYHGNAGLPIPPTPDFPILTLSHGLAGVIALWTGGLPSVNVQAPLNPLFLTLPLVALMPLSARRLTPEILWLAVAALLFAYFVNTDNPPFGGIYDWMYSHVPGWNLFREGSKFLFVVGMAYAILIPVALRMAIEWAATRTSSLRRTLVRTLATVVAAGVVGISLWTVGVLQSGALDSSTNPTVEPASFMTLSAMLAHDSRPGSLLWFGAPVTTEGLRHHTFIIASPTHPDVNLTGSYNASDDVTRRDPFQLFCGDPNVPYCYLDPQLFPYLTQTLGAAYIVVPSVPGVGTFPHGITRSWLQQQVTSMFGAPAALGTGNSQILVWRLTAPDPAVTTAAAVALVNGGTWTAAQALPALEAMAVPAAFMGTFDNSHYPAAPAALPDAVDVLPRTDGGCVGTAPSDVVVMAHTTSPSLVLNIANTNRSLQRVAATARLPGWAIYGPVNIGAGNVPMSTAATNIDLGPCIAWSQLAASALGSHSNGVTTVSVGSNGEQVTAASSSGDDHWVELRRLYDPGWRLDGVRPASTGDGIFALYRLDATRAASPKLTFAFSTLLWEHIGLLAAALVLILTLAAAVIDFRRHRGQANAMETQFAEVLLVPSPTGRWVASIGMTVLAFSALASTIEWFGVPSVAPITSFASDPYALDVGYGATAIAVLLLSVALRMVTHIRRAGAVVPSLNSPRFPARAGIAVALLAIASVTLISCGSSPGNVQGLISQAQQAGGVSEAAQGQSIVDARLARSSHHPLLCIADYTQALNTFPNLTLAYAGRGACYLSGGKNSAAAVHDYTEAIGLAPTQSALFLDRAAADRSSGNVSAALADYREGALLPAATPNQQLSAIDGLLALADDDAARAVYTQAVERHPQASVLHIAAADIAIADGDSAAAALDYTTALQLATTKAEVGQGLTRVCHFEVLLHEYAKAAVDCADAAQVSPTASGAYDDLSAVQLALGNPATALVDINSAIGAWIGDIGVYAQPSGVDGFGLARLYSARAWIEVQLHDISGAIADFTQAQLDLPTAAPDIRARLKAAIETAKTD